VHDVVEQGDSAAFFGTFTYRGRETGREVSSPFSLFAKLTNGKISYIQFLEDTVATSKTVNPKR
jgi:ketosteroid isomerase-like protein